MTGGVVFRVGEEVYFLPATTACKVLPMPEVAPVPGAPDELVGVALVEGEMIPVVALGELGRGPRQFQPGDRPRVDNRPMLLCTHLSERVGLVALEIVATGRFDSSDADHVLHEGRSAPHFDVGAVVNRLREGRWAV